ncbi:unnamed protein product [Ectocarpus sp. 12 AP-2014]
MLTPFSSASSNLDTLSTAAPAPVYVLLEFCRHVLHTVPVKIKSLLQKDKMLALTRPSAIIDDMCVCVCVCVSACVCLIA